MIEEIKNMTTWAEAEKWLAKHGYGLGQIAEQKNYWDAKSTKVTKTETKTATKIAEPKLETK